MTVSIFRRFRQHHAHLNQKLSLCQEVSSIFNKFTSSYSKGICYVHQSFRFLCPNSSKQIELAKSEPAGLAGCKLRDYPVDGRWTLTTPADFRCHGRTRVGPKLIQLWFASFLQILPCNKNSQRTFFFKGHFFFGGDSPQSVEYFKTFFFFKLVIFDDFCVSQVSQVWALRIGIGGKNA